MFAGDFIVLQMFRADSTTEKISHTLKSYCGKRNPDQTFSELRARRQRHNIETGEGELDSRNSSDAFKWTHFCDPQLESVSVFAALRFSGIY